MPKKLNIYPAKPLFLIIGKSKTKKPDLKVRLVFAEILFCSLAELEFVLIEFVLT
jgi:hypothetical protein